jgi:abequosyltransferase
MIDSSKLITIAIPTYNRALKLNKSLQNLTHCRDFADRINIRVHDNHSTDETPEVLAKWKEKFGDQLTITRHPSNLGLVGNYITCIESSNSEYIWVMGDDDDIRIEMIPKLLDYIVQEPGEGSYILNYRSIDGLTGKPCRPAVFPDDLNERFPQGSDFVEACQRCEYGSLMFITAVILKRKTAVAALSASRIEPENLALPFYITAVCAQLEGARLFAVPVFDGLHNVGSWIGHVFKVFNQDLPEALLALVEHHGYSRGLLESYLSSSGIRALLLDKSLIRHPFRRVESRKMAMRILRISKENI